MTFQIEQTEYLRQMNLFPLPYSAADKMVIRSGIKFLSENQWKLPYPLYCRYFKSYFLLYWRGDFLMQQIQNGIIEKDGIAYKVVYRNGLTRGKILARLEDQYAFSFRNPNDEWNLPAVVIVSTSTAK